MFLFCSTSFIVDLGIEFQVEVNFSISISAFLYCLLNSHITVENSKAILTPDPWGGVCV